MVLYSIESSLTEVPLINLHQADSVLPMQMAPSLVWEENKASKGKGGVCMLLGVSVTKCKPDNIKYLGGRPRTT